MKYLDKLLIAVCKANYNMECKCLEKIILLETANVNLAIQNNAAIGFASENGHIDVVKLLLSDERVLKEIRANPYDYHHGQCWKIIADRIGVMSPTLLGDIS